MTSSLEFSARPNEPVVEISRWFRSTPSKVFDAWTSPEHVCRWWGPPSLTLVECDVDLRVGGRYRYVLQGPDGRSYALDGQFVELDPPHRLVTNFTMSAAPDDQVVEVTSFNEFADGTAVRIVSLHRSCVARDAQLSDGVMEAGVADQFLRLDAVLAASTAV
jgi:uncharacterized protein YndB with AHSA1/START domain